MLKRNFIKGRMNKDVDERILPQGEYRDALNVRSANSEGSDVGSIENTLGNAQITDIDLGANAKCVGGIADEFGNKLYYFVKSDTASAVMEWDSNYNVLTKVLYDTRAGSANVLNLSGELITGVQIIIDSDNDKRFLVWVDENEPRMINIERAKGYGENGFEEEDILLIKKPPTQKPTIVLSESNNEESFLRESFLSFAYRYRYDDNQYSALSPFSEVAFVPGAFKFDYSTSSNESMVNRYNQVDIKFNTGDKRVKGIDIVYKESGSSAVYLIESIDKDNPNNSYLNNKEETFSFLNNKKSSLLPGDELGRICDKVPRQAFSLETIDNRIIFGNYIEDYNLLDSTGKKVFMDFSLSVSSTVIADNSPVKSIKSNRDYEIGISYLDKFGRVTSVLSSENNTVFLKNGLCNDENKLVATIKNKAPYFATKYRFFLKQNDTDYDTISPITFYQDGVFTWVKVEGDDVDKIKEGDFLYVKGDSMGILDTAVQTEVLEIKKQDKNFLETDDAITDTKQHPGTYFRIKPSDYVLSNDGANLHTKDAYGFKSSTTSNNIGNNISYLEPAVYYGESGLDDLTASGTYTGTEDIRYEIEITAVGSETFRWREYNITTGSPGAWNSGVTVTGGAQALSHGVSVTFGATSGHDLDDSWVVSAKAAQIVTDGNNSRKAWTALQSKSVTEETFKGGGTVTIKYKEVRQEEDGGAFNPNTIYEYTSEPIAITRDYANIEEWFIGDNIISQLEHPAAFENVIFRRGTPKKSPTETIDIDTTKDMFMIIQSSAEYWGKDKLQINASIEVFESQNNIILETKPKGIDTNIYFEIGKTYDIVSGLHQGASGDTNQTSLAPATITLDVFNCFAWSNGYESYKLRDKFNQKSFKIDTRPLSTIKDYRENKRIATLLYGGKYEQSTNYNGLNEFNPSQINFLDLDDKYGAIRKLYSREGDVIVFQEDRVQPVGYKKSILYDQRGNASVAKSDDILSPLQPYAGLYGISKNPESFAANGNMIYFTDARRGVVCRLGGDGINEISGYGMRDYFRDDFRGNKEAKKIGAYDPYHDQYVLHSEDGVLTEVPLYPCGSTLNFYNADEVHNYKLKFNDTDTRMTIGYNVTVGNIDIVATYDGTPFSAIGVTGAGNVVIDRTDLSIKDIDVTITPNTESTYEITHTCEEVGTSAVKVIVLNDQNDYEYSGASMVHKYTINAVSAFEETNVFQQSGTTLFKKIEGIDGQGAIPSDTDTIEVEAYSDDIESHKFYTYAGNRIGYLVSTEDYGTEDIDTILAAATFPAVTQVDGPGRTSKISFTLTKPTTDHIVYLIYDYKDIVVDAIDDSASVFEGDYVNIPVLANDIFGDPVTISITAQPANGTLTIFEGKGYIRYYHDGSATASDSFTYQISNQYGSDTATVNLTISAAPPTGEGDPGVLFNMSTTGNANSESSCALTINGTKYHNGRGAQPTLDDFIYTDSAKTTPFNGGNLYYAMDGNLSIKIHSTGRVTDVYYCTPGGGGGNQ